MTLITKHMMAACPSLMPPVLEMFKGMHLDASDQTLGNNYPQFNIVASQDVEEVLITTVSHNHHVCVHNYFSLMIS